MSAAVKPVVSVPERFRDELLHFSATPVTAVRLAKAEDDRLFGAKPAGFWVSVGQSWLEWCAAESFATDSFEYITRVLLYKDANVLRLGRARELDRFTRNYGLAGKNPRLETRAIDWSRVAAEYDGIIIAPYVWSRRLSLMWYYGWDCASGCIWNPRAVASIDCISLGRLCPAPSVLPARGEP